MVAPGIGSRNCLDCWFYRDTQELLEDSEIPVEKRFAIVERLGSVLRRSGYNQRFIRLLDNVSDPVVLAPRKKQVSICDIGPGSGAILESVAAWAQQHNIPVSLHGIDIDAEFGKLAQQRLAALGISATFHTADAADLKQFSTDHFDIVYSSQVVHHIRSTAAVQNFFKEIDRISAAAFLVVDIDRVLRGIPYMLAGPLAGGTKMLAIDGIRSLRRAYHRTEINALLAEGDLQQSDKSWQQAHCSFAPYWWITASRG